LLKLNGDEDDEKKISQLIIDAVGYNSWNNYNWK
jgi:hypothetical protein